MSLYRGRFAPSPTGPLHFGSLVAALGSCLEARSRGGEWLVRMEDLDRPREQQGAADLILRTLEAFGFEWDGVVVMQGGRTDVYARVLAELEAGGALFPCACTLNEIADSSVTFASARDASGALDAPLSRSGRGVGGEGFVELERERV